MTIEERIFIGIGSNLPSLRFGEPRRNVSAALVALADRSIPVVRCSQYYRSAPVPPSGQPDYVNAVVEVQSLAPPQRILDILHEIEAQFGRIRNEVNEARILDLDLLAYGDRVSEISNSLLLPHPRLHQRAFVLRPLADVSPDWRHPRSGRTVKEMLRMVAGSQQIELI
jgi:2-amino-4-hydroxy-6-hydroxymethyldihydropteridine diphosphokinase